MDLTELAALRAEALAHQQRASQAFRALHRAVAQAMDRGESASEIARAIGVNRVSVYDMARKGRQ